jgi:hypothetical protein
MARARIFNPEAKTAELLQEHIYNAWRSKKVLSLVSFNVKGAYNGVYKDRLLQRLTARGIPPTLVRWIDVRSKPRRDPSYNRRSYKLGEAERSHV